MWILHGIYKDLNSLWIQEDTKRSKQYILLNHVLQTNKTKPSCYFSQKWCFCFIYRKVKPLLIIIIHSLSSQSNAYIKGIISESHLSKFCCEQCWAIESAGLFMRVLWAAASLAHSWGTTGHFQASHHLRDQIFDQKILSHRVTIAGSRQ